MAESMVSNSTSAHSAPTANSDGRRKVPGEAGIWVFVLGEMTMFVAFFGVFVYERATHLEMFQLSEIHLGTTFGAVNTFLLLTGSLLVAAAVGAVRSGRGRNAQKFILAAVAMGAGFAVSKALEWSTLLSGGYGPHRNEFYMLFFMYTGVHFVHLLVGTCVLIYLWRIAGRLGRMPTTSQVRAVECGAIYWHFVDLIWVVLFALLYLMG